MKKEIFVCAVKNIKEGESKKFYITRGRNPLEGFLISFKKGFYALSALLNFRMIL